MPDEACRRRECQFSCDLHVGGVRLKLVPSVSASTFRLSSAYREFIVRPYDRPDVVLHMHRGLPPERSLGRPMWTSEPVSVYQVGSSLWWVLYDEDRDADPRCIATLEPLSGIGSIWFGDDEGELDALPGPLGAILTNHWLIHQRAGIMAHAFGVSHRGRGVLFAGYSGAGKTTLSRLWLKEAEARILSDDCVIVRRQSGSYWVYGTPWHSQERTVNNLAVPLERIFVIHHGETNQVIQLNPGEATAELLVRTFLPYWDAEGVSFMLDFVRDLVMQVPCFSLAFVPDGSVVDYVREML